MERRVVLPGLQSDCDRKGGAVISGTSRIGVKPKWGPRIGKVQNPDYIDLVDLPSQKSNDDDPTSQCESQFYGTPYTTTKNKKMQTESGSDERTSNQTRLVVPGHPAQPTSS
jgi:hypothetical protein